MRIRKHAKISPLLYTTSSQKLGTHLQTHICQLNQSPWDVMKFSPPSTPPPPPPPPQVDGDGGCAVNGSLRGCISVTESDHWEAKSATMKEEEEAPPPSPPEISEEKIICCKTDGKSWQCKKEAAKGSALCHHHMMQSRSYNNGYHYTGKKTEKLSAEARRPARTKKASATSNPYEFYYYSGFGPRWGKKRGETCNNINTTDDSNATDSHNNVEHEVEMVGDESDFEEYEDEEEIDSRDNNIIGKKRVRKPIKARSLKSLM